MTLRARYTLVLSLLSIALTNGVVWTLFVDQRQMVTRNLDANEERQIGEFTTLCRQTQLINNDLVLFNFVRVLAKNPAITYAALLGRDGIAQVHSDARFALHPLVDYEGALKIPVIRRETAIPDGDGTRAVIGFSEIFRAEHYHAELRRLLKRSAALSLASLIAAALGSFWLATGITRRLRIFNDCAMAVGHGDFQRRVDIPGKDELNALAQVFNQMTEKLAALDQLKDEFIATVSHDLRSPVGAMIMTIDTLEQGTYGALNEAQVKCLRLLKSSGQRLVAFVNNVLDSAKIKAGKLELHCEPVNIAEAVSCVVELFVPAAQAKGLSLSQDVPADLPLVNADRQKLEQILNNLVGNAMKFTRNGGRIAVNAALSEACVQVSVKDSGIGISPADLPKMFKKFQQVDMAAQRELHAVGTGLGLSICQSIVEAQGGRIWVDSEKGKGSSFNFTLPLFVQK